MIYYVIIITMCYQKEVIQNGHYNTDQGMKKQKKQSLLFLLVIQ